MENPDGHAGADTGAGLGRDPTRPGVRASPTPTAALRRRRGASGQRPSQGSPTTSPASPGGCRVRRGAGSQRIRVPGRARLAERDLRRGGGLLGHGGTAPPPPRWPSPWSPSSVVASVEEARLWHVVTVDCLDFDAWTTLIEERERIAECSEQHIENTESV